LCGASIFLGSVMAIHLKAMSRLRMRL
jgi:hypothetical protein